MALPDAPTAPATGAIAFGRRGLVTLVIGVAIALCLSLMPGQRLAASLAFSVCIALACWFFIDGGRLLAARWVHRAAPDDGGRRDWPGWPAMALVLPLGTVAGYALGHAVARALLGEPTQSLAEQDPRALAAILLLSMIPGLVATRFYFVRAHLEASRTRAAQAERLAAEQRLALLASQLEPHMLFNTLANLRVLIGIDPARAQAMLDRLVAFLRATLQASRTGAHSLAAEFERLADYLALMQLRMGARLQARLDLPDELRRVEVPPLLLQPLVENCIKHGLEPKVGGGSVEVVARRAGDRLVLEVRDSGVGLGLGLGRGGGGAAGATRFGLQQVRERLAAQYAGRAGLELVDAEGGGTLARITLPLAP